MNDVLPDAGAPWESLEQTLRQWLAQYGYLNMRVPILEHTRLFTRGIGEVTDIVEKEMYTFVDSLNDDSLTMRPEFTAGLVRATIEHNLLYDPKTEQNRVFYSFRHTYATLALTHDKVPIHTLAKQMGTSVLMIERHYSHLKVIEATEQLSGKESRRKIAATSTVDELYQSTQAKKKTASLAKNAASQIAKQKQAKKQ